MLQLLHFYSGELAALTAAFLWTCSSMIWGKINLPAFTLNACKNCIGVIFIVGHVTVVSLVTGAAQVSFQPAAWGWLALSGLVGIVIGDTLYFRSLQILGPRRALVLACLSPFFAVALDLIFAQASLNGYVLQGVLLTVGGVMVVVLDRRARKESPGLMPGKIQTGIAYGALGAACQAVGGMFSQQGMEYCGVLEATMVRLLAAALLTICWIGCRQKNRAAARAAFKFEHIKFLVPATALGTWLGILCSQIAYDRSYLSIAQTLLSTCPLFAIPVMWILHRQKVNALGWCGTVFAVFGIWLTMYGK